jgi:hypothetical protein
MLMYTIFPQLLTYGNVITFKLVNVNEINTHIIQLAHFTLIAIQI